MPHQSSSLMNSTVSYKLSMAHKFSNIKAITVLCKSAENLALSTLSYLAENETVRLPLCPPLPFYSVRIMEYVQGWNKSLLWLIQSSFSIKIAFFALARATWKSRERRSSDSFIINLDSVA